MLSRRSTLPDTSASSISQRNGFDRKWKNDTSSCRTCSTTSSWNNCLPSETTGRICLAVSCWRAACVFFWKASWAWHLQGSSTTSTRTSSPAESKISHQRDEKGTYGWMPTTPPFPNHSSATSLGSYVSENKFSCRDSRWNRSDTCSKTRRCCWHKCARSCVPWRRGPHLEQVQIQRVIFLLILFCLELKHSQYLTCSRKQNDSEWWVLRLLFLISDL